MKLPLLACLFFYTLTARAEIPSVKIAASLALTGKLAFTGEAQAHGLELAAAKINEDGGINGRTVKLSFEDNAGDPKQAVAGVQKLIGEGNQIFYVGLTHIVQAVKSLLKQNKALMLYAAGVPGPAAESPLFFRDWGDSEVQGRLLAEGIAQAGKHSAVFLGEENDACILLKSQFTSRAADLGITISKSESYNPGETDFRTILLQLTSTNPSAIALCAFRDSGTIMTQLNALGRNNIQVFHTYAPFIPFNDSAPIRKLYEENNSVSSWTGYIPDSPEPSAEAFAKEYKKKFGVEPRFEALLAYDGLLAIGAAARRCDPSDTLTEVCIAAELDKSEFSGVLGPLAFDSRKARRADFLMQVKAGRWERIQK